MSAESRTPSVPRCADGLHTFREMAICTCGIQASGPERATSREGMVTVYDEWGRYLGCMGKQTWEDLLRDADHGGYLARDAYAYSPSYHDGA